MTRREQFRLMLMTCGLVLQAALPRHAMAFVPALVTLVAYLLALPLARDAQGACVVGFIAGYGAHAWLRLPGLIKSEAAAMFGSESAVIFPLALAALMVGIGDPVGCLRVFSVFAGLRALLLGHDLWQGRFDYMRRVWPDNLQRSYDALMTQVFLGWCLAQVLLVEIVIASGSLALWLTFAALAQVLIGTVDRVLVQAVLRKRKDLNAR